MPTTQERYDTARATLQDMAERRGEAYGRLGFDGPELAAELATIDTNHEGVVAEYQACKAALEQQEEE